MSNRLNTERRATLSPERMKYAKEQIEALGYSVTERDDNAICFDFKGCPVVIFVYSGWFTGRSVKDGRGIGNLLKQLKP